VQSVPKESLFASLPAPWPEDVLPAIQEAVTKAGRSIVVIDDDPTGTQTVYDVPVLTEWTRAAIEQEFKEKAPLFYIQTNSRSFPTDRAREVAREIGERLRIASDATGQPFTVISRSDSTLRGHYPSEVDALAHSLDMDYALRVVVPFFLEGGRYTINDIHWVEEGELLTPVGETPFAGDASFGYTSSNLRDWIQEKTDNKIAANKITSISIKTIREEGPAIVSRQLMRSAPGSVCIVNAATNEDLEVATLGCLYAEQMGRSIVYRTGASFVRAYAGLNVRPLLAPEDLGLPAKGAGLVVVGSHVPMSTRQLEHLLAHTDVLPVELDAKNLLIPEEREATIQTARGQVLQALTNGKDAVLFTSRSLLIGDSKRDSLRIARAVSSGIVDIISQLDVRPRYIVAKGGITSSDVATRGLGVKRALVKGQIIPGVPVNLLGAESRFPGMVYIVFPGNVGKVDSITHVVLSLSLPSL